MRIPPESDPIRRRCHLQRCQSKHILRFRASPLRNRPLRLELEGRMSTLNQFEPGSPRNQRRPTIRDVAALAGVSLKTVSRVINGETAVSAKVRTRVQAAVDRLVYQRNMTASSLRRSDGKSATIGLLLEDAGNPFSSTLHRSI